MAKELHPRKHQPPIPNNSVTEGRNYDLSVYPESEYIRCSRCNQVMNTARHTKGWGVGIRQNSTQLNGTVSVGATTINVDSTTGFEASGYIYIYDSGLPLSTPSQVNKVAYTGVTGTSFTGCTSAKAHGDDMDVRDEPKDTGGCPFCGSFEYD